MTQKQGRPALAQPLSHKLLAILLRGTSVGELTVQLPTGDKIAASAGKPGPAADIRFATWGALARIVWQGDIGAAVGYMRGDWTTGDLANLIEWAARNEQQFMESIKGSAPARLLTRVVHLMNGNTRSGSRRNVVAHYDLGNDFYRLWLDQSMMYSSAIYANSSNSLEEAQQYKIGRILALLNLDGANDVLEIGSGWGAVALAIARSSAARTIGVSLSPSQVAAANDRAQGQAGADRVRFELKDYRDIGGVFDRIVSIEMLEAVGRRYLPNYFDIIRKSLRPEGRCVLQVITIADDRFETYCRRPDFIQRYIFPGGFLPSKSYLREAMRAAGLKLISEEHFGDSYARTLKEWRQRFWKAWPEIEALGFDQGFRRMWEYYLSYCEGGFRAGVIDVGLYCLTRS